MAYRDLTKKGKLKLGHYGDTKILKNICLKANNLFDIDKLKLILGHFLVTY